MSGVDLPWLISDGCLFHKCISPGLVLSDQQPIHHNRTRYGYGRCVSIVKPETIQMRFALPGTPRVHVKDLVVTETTINPSAAMFLESRERSERMHFSGEYIGRIGESDCKEERAKR